MTMAIIKIGHASLDENRNINGGAAGDQTGGEVYTRSWYNANWDVVLRPKKKAIAEASAKAVKAIEDIVAEVEVGRTYMGKVVRITDFGAFVEVLPGKDGLVHISQLALERVKKVEDVVKIGDEIMVKCIEIDEKGRVNLSRKVLLSKEEN